jgi:hypothetical protein
MDSALGLVARAQISNEQHSASHLHKSQVFLTTYRFLLMLSCCLKLHLPSASNSTLHVLIIWYRHIDSLSLKCFAVQIPYVCGTLLTKCAFSRNPCKVEVYILGAAMKYHFLKQTFVWGTEMFKHIYEKQNFVTGCLHQNQSSAEYAERWEENKCNSESRLGLSVSLERKWTSWTLENQPQNPRAWRNTVWIPLIFILYSNWISTSQRTLCVSIINTKCQMLWLWWRNLRERKNLFLDKMILKWILRKE